MLHLNFVQTARGGWLRQRCHVSSHRGVQLILAYSWARPAVFAAGKGRGEMFLLCPRHFQWGAYSITAVRTYVRPVRPSCT